MEEGVLQGFPSWKVLYIRSISKCEKEGKSVKCWWFNTRALQLVSELYPGMEFKTSHQWLGRFRKRYEISLRRKTHVTQKSPMVLESAIAKFHSNITRIRREGTYSMNDIAYLDQTPILFVLDYSPKNADKSSAIVCYRCFQPQQTSVHIRAYYFCGWSFASATVADIQLIGITDF